MEGCNILPGRGNVSHFGKTPIVENTFAVFACGFIRKANARGYNLIKQRLMAFNGVKVMITMRILMMVFLSGLLLSGAADAAESANAPSSSQELGKLQALANHGDAAAQLKLAMMYYNGDAQNKAAVESQASVNHNLALMYAHGRSMPENYAEAWKWRHKDTDEGHARVENVNDNLALMYAHGRSVPENYAEAWKWRHAAAEKNDKAAKDSYASVNDNLGLMYAHGRSMPENYAEAWKWRHVAEQGVPQNYAKALEWALIAKAEGDHDAIHDVSLIEGKAAPAQIAHGQAMANQWEAKHLQ